MRITKPILAGAALVLALFAPAVGAQATEMNPVQVQIDQILQEFPGGTQIAANQISWDDGGAILTLPSGSARAVGSCATGRFCAYSGNSLSGAQLSFSTCSATNSTAAVSPVRSVANGRTSGSVYGYNGGSVALTVGAGSWSNTAATITRLGC